MDKALAPYIELPSGSMGHAGEGLRPAGGPLFSRPDGGAWGRDAAVMKESTLNRADMLTLSPVFRYSLGAQENRLSFREGSPLPRGGSSSPRTGATSSTSSAPATMPV